jgi:hypothetical protein
MESIHITGKIVSLHEHHGVKTTGDGRSVRYRLGVTLESGLKVDCRSGEKKVKEYLKGLTVGSTVDVQGTLAELKCCCMLVNV